jgi:hypothetical protein
MGQVASVTLSTGCTYSPDIVRIDAGSCKIESKRVLFVVGYSTEKNDER